jgi:predicted transcriptional regulator
MMSNYNTPTSSIPWFRRNRDIHIEFYLILKYLNDNADNQYRRTITRLCYGTSLAGYQGKKFIYNLVELGCIEINDYNKISKLYEITEKGRRLLSLLGNLFDIGGSVYRNLEI